MKKNVLVITGTRADFGLLHSTLNALRKSQILNFELLVTGMHMLQRYKLSLKEIQLLGFSVDCFVAIREDGNMLSWLSQEILGIAEYCGKKLPNCVLVLGDRDEALAGAIVGSHLGIPVAHIHGGDVTGKTTVDQLNRDAITQLSAYHFAVTEKSARRISAMKQNAQIFEVGAPGIDFLKTVKKASRTAMAKKFSLSNSKNWFLIIMHPESLEKHISYKNQILSVVQAVEKFPAEKIWVYPNSDTGTEVFVRCLKDLGRDKTVHLYSHILRRDFVQLLQTVDVLIGNSSAGIIESTFFHLPVVNVGDRQRYREHSTNVISAGYNVDKIVEGIKKALSPRFKSRCEMAKQLYGQGCAGSKIVSVLEKVL